MNVVCKYGIPAEDDLLNIYEKLGWSDFLKLSSKQLILSMEQSYLVVSAYVDNNLVGTGRVISDGVISAYICGVGVLPEYRNKGIGTSICNKLTKYCKDRNLYIQVFCEEELIAYYEKLGFEKFAIGMKH